MGIEKFIYHYSAIYQTVIGSINNLDGIATMTNEILDYEEYIKLKTYLKDNFTEGIEVENITIVSLSRLN